MPWVMLHISTPMAVASGLYLATLLGGGYREEDETDETEPARKARKRSPLRNRKAPRRRAPEQSAPVALPEEGKEPRMPWTRAPRFAPLRCASHR